LSEQSQQRIRNSNFRQYVDVTKSLSGESRYGIVRINVGNTLEHEMKKLEVCFELKSTDQQFLTECRFKNGKRADVFILDTAEVIEIVHSEPEESIVRKSNEYPDGVKILVVRA